MEGEKQNPRVFAALLGIALVSMFGLIFPFFRGNELPLWPWIAAGIFWLIPAICPRLLAPLQRLVQYIGSRGIEIVNWCVLAISYYLVLVPYSFVLRAAGKVSIPKHFNSNVKSYRVLPDRKPPIDLEKPF